MGDTSKVYVIKTSNRGKGAAELTAHFDTGRLRSKRVAIKANYNSDDEFPASTHVDTLKALVDSLKGQTLFLQREAAWGIPGEYSKKKGFSGFPRKWR